MSQSSPPPAPVGRLPVLPTAQQAYAIVLGEPGLLVRAIAAPFLLSMLIAGLTVMMPASTLVSLLLAFASLVPYTLFGVAWSRLTLLGPVAGRPPLLPFWAARHWRFFGFQVAMAVIAFGLLLPPLVVAMVQAAAAGRDGAGPSLLVLALGELAVLLGMAYLAARLSFVFPAAAADEIYSWRHSWAHTRGQGLRLLAVIALCVVPAATLIWVVAQGLGVFILPEMDPAVVHDEANRNQMLEQYMIDNAGRLFAAQTVITGMSYLVMAVAASAIALAFRISTGWVPAASPPAPTA